MLFRDIIWAIFACVTAAIVSDVNVRCPAGTRVYSISVWSGSWLDGLILRCTGDGGEHTVPKEFDDDPGGMKDGGICAGTGGVQSLYWEVPVNDLRIVNFNITCLDNQTYQFADGRGYNYWGTTESRNQSCGEGEYAEGIYYYVYQPEDPGTFSFYLMELELLCTSAPLDPICTDCNGDNTLLSDEDQPEYCALPVCSEAECCQSKTDEEDDQADSFTDDIIIGVVTTVVATVIVSVAAWTCHKIREKRTDGKGVNEVQVEGTVNRTAHSVGSSPS